MKVMVLAAGLGARLVPHTLITPKSALPFLNVPLATYGIELLAPAKPSQYIVNTFHLPEKVEHLFSKQLSPWLPQVQFSIETGIIRGSGGGLKLAEKYFEGEDEIILINADEVFFPEDPEFILKAIEFHRWQKSLSTIITTHHHEVGKKFGAVWTNNQDKVLGFGKEKVAGSQKGQHFIGIQILSKEIFSYLKSDKDFNILYDGLTPAIAAGKPCWAFPVEGVWFEAGSQVDFLDATRESLNLLTLNQLPASQYLSRFLKKYSPRSQFVQAPESLILAHQSAKWSGDQIRNFAVLAEGSEILQGAFVDSSVIGPNVQVKSDLNFALKVT